MKIAVLCGGISNERDLSLSAGFFFFKQKTAYELTV